VSASTDERPPVLLELPDPEPPRRRRRRTSRWWRYGFPAALVVLVLAVPVLVWTGIQVVLQSNDGRLIASTADPSSPGWEATIPTTPTMLVATVDNTGGLSSVAVLALSADREGSIVYIPADTLVDVGGRFETLVQSYVRGGVQGLQAAVRSLTGTALTDTMVANSRNWQELVAPAGPLSIQNPDDVIVNGVRLFPQGHVVLQPDQVGAFVESRNWGEDDTNRLLRQETFWQAWIQRIGTVGASAVPGETDAGIGRYLRTFAHDQAVDYEILPVKVQALTTAYAGVYLPLPEARGVLALAIPFPASPTPGARPTVRVLDGTGRLGHGLVAARNLALDGGQITIIGNAASFREPQTEFIVANASQRAAAQRLRDAFGVGTVVVNPNADDSVDVTVVLGADALGKAQAENPPTRSTTTAPSTSSPTASSTTTSG
jgi:hypothetical protein